jgi:hypothetical protein
MGQVLRVVRLGQVIRVVRLGQVLRVVRLFPGIILPSSLPSHIHPFINN